MQTLNYLFICVAGLVTVSHELHEAQLSLEIMISYVWIWLPCLEFYLALVCIVSFVFEKNERRFNTFAIYFFPVYNQKALFHPLICVVN